PLVRRRDRRRHRLRGAARAAVRRDPGRARARAHAVESPGAARRGAGAEGGARSMNYLLDAFAFLLDPANWPGVNGLAERFQQHLLITALSIVFAAAIAIPLGLLIGHTGRGRGAVIAITGAARALPTFGVL